MGRLAVFAVAAALIAGCAAPSPLTIAPDSLPDASVGQAYSQRIEVGNVVSPWDHVRVRDGSTLPPGLSLESLTTETAGRILGTPTAAGSWTFTLQANARATGLQSGQVTDKQYTLTIH